MRSRLSIRAYLTISYALFVFVVLGMVDLYWFARQEAQAEQALRSQLEHQTRLLATLLDIDKLAQGEVFLPSFYTAVEANLQVLFVTPGYEIRNLSNLPLAPEQEPHVANVANQALRGSTSSREIYGPEWGDESLYGATPVFDAGGNVLGVVCLILPLDNFEATVMEARIGSLWFVAAVAVVSIPFGWILASLLTHRLLQAQRSAAKVAAGDYQLRLPEGGPKELDQLARSLNQMGEELVKRDKARKVLLANMTHELARPLGGLRLAIESLLGGALEEPETAESMLNDMAQSIKRMEALIEDLALSARPSSRRLQLQRSKLALVPLLHGLQSRYLRRAELRGIQLGLELPDTLPDLHADEVRLSQILGNLVDNALKFTPTGGTVTIYGEQQDGRVEIGVWDTGPGIPEGEVERLLQPFTQGSNVSDIRQGMGLGLSIVNELTQAHLGELVLRNQPGGGLRAGVRLPVSS